MLRFIKRFFKTVSHLVQPNQGEILKRNYEKWAAQTLLESLDEKGYTLLAGQAKQMQPDIIATSKGNNLGIEVTTIYYDDQHARQAWDNYKLSIDSQDTLINLNKTDQLVIFNIQQALNRKSLKHYHANGQLWLCLVIHQPLKSAQIIQQAATALTIPQPNPFDSIYVLYHQEDSLNSYQHQQLLTATSK